jgi:hypothetical protein
MRARLLGQRFRSSMGCGVRPHTGLREKIQSRRAQNGRCEKPNGREGQLRHNNNAANQLGYYRGGRAPPFRVVTAMV